MEEEIKQKINKMLEESTQTPAEVISNDAEKAVINYQKEGIKSISEKVDKGEINMNEAGKDLAHIMMAAESMQDTDDNAKFRQKFKEKKQEELLASADKSLVEEEARKLQAKRIKAEEFYKSFRPILEMDLSPFLNNDNSQKRVKYVKQFDKNKNRMVKVPIEETEQQEETRPAEEPKKKVGYDDRSYGIPFMVFILIFLTIPYLIAAVVLSTFNIINAIFVACSKFSKPAFVICTGIAGITLIGIFIYVVLLCIEAAFNIQIIPDKAAYAEMIANL